MDTRILAVGITQSYCWAGPKPLEFGNSGQNWENVGWRVKVQFTELTNKIRPKDHIDVLRPLLPERYSPLQPNGNGLQSVYLTKVPTALAEVLIGLIGQEVAPIAMAASVVMPVAADDLDAWEQELEQGGRHLLAAKLRRSNIDASAGTVEELARIISRIRARWPRVRILLRADSGFCREAIMTWAGPHQRASHQRCHGLELPVSARIRPGTRLSPTSRRLSRTKQTPHRPMTPQQHCQKRR